MSMKQMVWLVAVVMAACAGGARPPQPEASPPPPSEPGPAVGRDGPQTPVTVTVEAVSGAPAAGGRVLLRAHVIRHGAWAAPIAVDFRLPAGVTPASGALAATHVALPADATPGEGTVDLEIAIGGAAVPVDDVVVIAESQVAGGGFHAEARYRFGRAAPKANATPPSGPDVRSSKGDLGPATPLKP
jgi:hypothetical protein